MWQRQGTQNLERTPKFRPAKIAVLLFILGYIVSVHVQLRLESSFTDKSKRDKGWQQPDRVSQHYPVLIGQEKWSFDFVPVERVVAGLKVNEQGDLEVDAETEKRLALATAGIPPELSQVDLKRITFLIRKSVSGQPGKDFALLLERYFGYQQKLAQYRMQQMAENKTSANTPKDFIQFRNQLQRELFGLGPAKKLFVRKNLTADYILRRQSVSSDSSLSMSQKQLRLDQIKQTYLRELAALESTQ